MKSKKSAKTSAAEIPFVGDCRTWRRSDITTEFFAKCKIVHPDRYCSGVFYYDLPNCSTREEAEKLAESFERDEQDLIRREGGWIEDDEFTVCKNTKFKKPTKKTTKKPVKKVAKKAAKKRRATKSRAKTPEDKITEVLSKVSEICDYAIDNLCTEPSQFEELELLLRDYIK